jgi:cation diffusion facilitator family transporter
MKNQKQAVALGSMAASALMTVGKFAIGLATGSLGLVSEGLHSLLDFGATILTYAAVRVSDKPADREHPYGHGKVESIAALGETVLLFLTSIWIVYEAVHRLLAGKIEVEANIWSVVVIVASILIDLSRARALSRVAKATNSQALEADALHFSSDVLSSAVVLLGLGLVALGWPEGDALAAIGVSVFVCHAGWALGRRTIDALIDTAPVEATERLVQLIASVQGVVGVDRVRLRPVGSQAFIEAEISVGRGLSQTRVEAVRAAIRHAVHASMPEAEMSIVARPLALDDETVHQRVSITAAGYHANVHHITVHRSGDILSLAFDLEVDDRSTVREAHEIASCLEADLRTEFGTETEIETHIEPMRDRWLEGVDLPPEETGEIRAFVQKLVDADPALSDLHKVRARETDMGLIVYFHCRTDPDLTVEAMHERAERIEHALRHAFRSVWRIVAHIEPRLEEAS